MAEHSRVLRSDRVVERRRLDQDHSPLFQFHDFGEQLPHHWTTITNESAFGVDYYTLTAVARSNILVHSPNETKYFYADLDEDGNRLNAEHRTRSPLRPGRRRRCRILVAVDLRGPLRQPDDERLT